MFGCICVLGAYTCIFPLLLVCGVGDAFGMPLPSYIQRRAGRLSTQLGLPAPVLGALNPIFTTDYSAVFPLAPPEAVDLLYALWRPTTSAVDALEHPLFVSIRRIESEVSFAVQVQASLN